MGLAMMLLRKAKKPPAEEGDEEKDGESMGMQDAAQEMLAAIEAKDAKALASAMKACCEMCMSESE